jgi:hypothetical protein
MAPQNDEADLTRSGLAPQQGDPPGITLLRGQDGQNKRWDGSSTPRSKS